MAKTYLNPQRVTAETDKRNLITAAGDVLTDLQGRIYRARGTVATTSQTIHALSDDDPQGPWRDAIFALDAAAVLLEEIGDDLGSLEGELDWAQSRQSAKAAEVVS